MIVTIDGPAGSGKSTVARGLAARLEFEFLDTGAMFRAVAFAFQRLDIEPASARAAEFLTTLRIELPRDRVLLNGEDVSVRIRTPEVTAGSSKVAVLPAVRDHLAKLQRTIAAGRDMVCEGRDQGTVVFPDAACKFFLTACPEARARRRLEERLARGESVTLEAVRAEQEERDRRDSMRELAPLKPAEDAIVVDTGALSVAEVIDRLEREVRRCARG